VASQFLLAVPLWLLFELGVLLASVFGGKADESAAGE
jgi:Sec-independent protein secretion pathway component TatC